MTGQLVGYARTSTVDQEYSLGAQREQLEALGCSKVFHEQVSSIDKDRRYELEKALDYIRDGDALVVTKLDRLARSVRHLTEITDQLDSKGASLRILDMDLDTSTSTGRLMLNMLGSVAQFEREVLKERQREGIERARKEGKYKGRKPTAKNQAEDVLEMRAQGWRPAHIARELGIGRSSVYRILKENPD